MDARRGRVDDGDERRRRGVGVGKVPAGHQLDPECQKEPRAHDVGIDHPAIAGHGAASLALPVIVGVVAAFHVQAEDATVAAEHGDARHARRFHARQPFDPLDRLAIELTSLVARVAQQVDVERRGDEPLDVDAGIDAARGLEAADEQSGDDQEQQRQRDLGDDQHAPQIERARRSNPAVPRSFSAGTSSGREARNAGATPNRMPVKPDSANAKSSTRWIDREVDRAAAEPPAEVAPPGTLGRCACERHTGERRRRARATRFRSATDGRGERGSRRAPAGRPARAASTRLSTAAGWRCWRRQSAGRRPRPLRAGERPYATPAAARGCLPRTARA